MKNTAPEPEMQLSVDGSRREDKTQGLIAKDKESDLEQAADPTLTEDLALALLARNTFSVGVSRVPVRCGLAWSFTRVLHVVSP